MTLRGATRLLVVVVAVSSAGWNLHISAQATEVPFPWVPTFIALLPHVVAIVAAFLVRRVSPWWRCAALTYVAAFAALEAVALVQIVPFASQYETESLVWSVATSSLALTAAVVAVMALRREDPEPEHSPPSPLRWAAVAGGLLLVASSLFAWSVSSTAPTESWIFVLGRASIGMVVGSVVGMAVLAGITAVVAASPRRSMAAGATAGLLASRPLALSVFTDSTWEQANAELVAGWWLALGGQALLVVALLALLAGGADRSDVSRDRAPTAWRHDQAG